MEMQELKNEDLLSWLTLVASDPERNVRRGDQGKCKGRDSHGYSWKMNIPLVSFDGEQNVGRA